MDVKESIRKLVRQGARLGALSAESGLRDSRNVDLVLEAALRDSNLHDPVSYVDFVRGCIEPSSHWVTEVKADGDRSDKAGKRFDIFVKELQSGLPPVEFPIAKEFGLIADASRFELASKLPDGWMADLGIFFARSSSSGRKGRILFDLIRYLRCENCLELGTCMGMSSLFLLAALTAYTTSGHLTTVEGDGNLFSVSSALLRQRYGKTVACHHGWVQNILPELVESIGPLDFMFHDCGHSAEAYTRDFGNVVKSLTSGSVVLFDDIRWEDTWKLWRQDSARTYEGWQEVVGHDRVRRAVEIDGELGLLLMR